MRLALADLDCWHPWFAWRPVRAGRAVVWLEWVERRLYHEHEYGVGEPYAVYRLKPHSDTGSRL